MSRGAIVRRALSNVLLGVALGLSSYYALTTVAGWFEQRGLREHSAAIPAFSEPLPEAAAEASSTARVLDFQGWAEHDKLYWSELAEGEVFGRLVVPAIGLDSLVVRGTGTSDLRRGPGWMDWTSLPGPEGTCGIAGHRTTYGAPFRRVGELAPGDTIDFYSPYRRYRYSVMRTLVVRPSQTEVLDPTERPSLVLSACHPPYSARYRIVVQAELVEVQLVSGEQGNQ